MQSIDLRLPLAAIAVSLLAACNGPGASSCVPGRSLSCVGPGGCAATQMCLADGSAFGRCLCVGGPDGGAGFDGATADAAARDSGITPIQSDGDVPLPDGTVPVDGGADASVRADGGGELDAARGDGGPIVTDAGLDAGAPGPCTIDLDSHECHQCLFDAEGRDACVTGPCSAEYTTVGLCGVSAGCCTTCVTCVETACPTQTRAATICALDNCPLLAAACE